MKLYSGNSVTGAPRNVYAFSSIYWSRQCSPSLFGSFFSFIYLCMFFLPLSLQSYMYLARIYSALFPGINFSYLQSHSVPEIASSAFKLARKMRCICSPRSCEWVSFPLRLLRTTASRKKTPPALLDFVFSSETATPSL